MKRTALALGCVIAFGRSAQAAPDCPPPASSLRVMLHDPGVLAERLSLLAKADRKSVV